MMEFETVNGTSNYRGSDDVAARSVLHQSVLRVDSSAGYSRAAFSIAHLEILTSVFGIRLVKAVIAGVRRSYGVVSIYSGHCLSVISRQLCSGCFFSSLILVGQVQEITEATAVTGDSITRLLEWKPLTSHLSKAETAAFTSFLHVGNSVAVKSSGGTVTSDSVGPSATCALVDVLHLLLKTLNIVKAVLRGLLMLVQEFLK